MQTREEIVKILNRWGVQWQERPQGEIAYRLVGVREIPHIEIKVRVEDQDRQAIDGVPVLFYYPEDYPDTLNLSGYKWNPPVSVGDVVIADNGLAKMVMSGDWKVGDFYHGADTAIKTGVLIADPEIPSDMLYSVGMLVGGPDDKSHAALRLTFRLIDPAYVSVAEQIAEMREMVKALTERITTLEKGVAY